MAHHLTAEHVSEEMHECITRCSDCHDVCLETVQHCLSRGGEHAAAEHIRALLDCAQVCDTSRDFMLRAPSSTPKPVRYVQRPASGVPSRASRWPALTR